jgi:hypothetical protein
MKPISRFAGLVVMAMLLSAAVFGQNTLKGMVKDSTGSAVPSASINLKDSTSHAIIAYAVTDPKGTYMLQVPAGRTPAGLLIEVRSIGFKSQVKPVAGFDVPVDFVLSGSVNELQTVLIKSSRPVLRTHGDTLGYHVSDFAGPQDRTIGEVIRKLPGITVAGDGTIRYNNKPISALYVGGDNLLDDKYTIATNSIPQLAVSEVQAIQNDQPVKV